MNKQVNLACSILVSSREWVGRILKKKIERENKRLDSTRGQVDMVRHLVWQKISQKPKPDQKSQRER